MFWCPNVPGCQDDKDLDCDDKYSDCDDKDLDCDESQLVMKISQ